MGRRTKMNEDALTPTRWDRKPIPSARWGKDHWSTFMYLETRAVDHRGSIDLRHMRTAPGGLRRQPVPGDYPTKLNDGELYGHDDWDCAEDLEHEGLVENVGTGLNPLYRLTDRGWIVANLIRRHRAEGLPVAEFRLPETAVADRDHGGLTATTLPSDALVDAERRLFEELRRHNEKRDQIIEEIERLKKEIDP